MCARTTAPRADTASGVRTATHITHPGNGARDAQSMETVTRMVVDGEESLTGDEADYWIMWKAQHQKMSANVYLKGQFIWVGGLRPTDSATEKS